MNKSFNRPTFFDAIGQSLQKKWKLFCSVQEIEFFPCVPLPGTVSPLSAIFALKPVFPVNFVAYFAGIPKKTVALISAGEFQAF